MSRLKDNDEFGARMKEYERTETAWKFSWTFPVYARLDGRGFSKFTRHMEKPFDSRMTNAMIETTKYLVEHTNAKIGYTQSDEISLVWAEQPMFFDGKNQKVVSILASLTTAKFIHLMIEEAARLPHFDARVFELPSKMEASNMFLWRAMDAKKNAISAVAQFHFSHKQLQGKNQEAMLLMLCDHGVNFKNYDAQYRFGTFVRKEVVERYLTPEEEAYIPTQHIPEGMVLRNDLKTYNIPNFNKVTNRVGFIFDKEEPNGY